MVGGDRQVNLGRTHSRAPLRMGRRRPVTRATFGQSFDAAPTTMKLTFLGTRGEIKARTRRHYRTPEIAHDGMAVTLRGSRRR